MQRQSSKETDQPTGTSVAEPSRLQAELAARILNHLKELGVGAGYHLVEHELCDTFAVSRTPVRGALNLLAQQGIVSARPNRGYVLNERVKVAPAIQQTDPTEEEDKKLFVDIAEARNTGLLPDVCSQQEIVRIFDAKLSTVVRVLRQLSELGLVERKPGNGWSFLPSIASPFAQAESYAFRRVIEPQLVLQPTFVLDRIWAKRAKERHLAFRNRQWRDTLSIEFYEMNSDFHEMIARCSGNRYLLDAVQRQIRVRSFLNYHWDYGVDRVRSSIDEHLEIFDALENGNNLKASKLIHNHLDASSKFSKQHLGDDVDQNVAEDDEQPTKVKSTRK